MGLCFPNVYSEWFLIKVLIDVNWSQCCLKHVYPILLIKMHFVAFHVPISGFLCRWVCVYMESFKCVCVCMCVFGYRIPCLQPEPECCGRARARVCVGVCGDGPEPQALSQAGRTRNISIQPGGHQNMSCSRLCRLWTECCHDWSDWMNQLGLPYGSRI